MIFVDDLMQHGTPGRYRGALAAQAERVGARNGHRWCHLFSDKLGPDFRELHDFAALIGMKRSWFQGDHYDLTPGRRAAAVRAGAKELERHEAVAIWRKQREAKRARMAAPGALVTCEHSPHPHPLNDDGTRCLFPKEAP